MSASIVLTMMDLDVNNFEIDTSWRWTLAETSCDYQRINEFDLTFFINVYCLPCLIALGRIHAWIYGAKNSSALSSFFFYVPIVSGNEPHITSFWMQCRSYLWVVERYHEAKICIYFPWQLTPSKQVYLCFSFGFFFGGGKYSNKYSFVLRPFW